MHSDISSWTSFLHLEGSEFMHTSSLVAYHITSFMLYESSYTDIRPLCYMNPILGPRPLALCARWSLNSGRVKCLVEA